MTAMKETEVLFDAFYWGAAYFHFEFIVLYFTNPVSILKDIHEFYFKVFSINILR